MDFIDRIKALSAQVPRQIEHIQTEEATKNALVMPFIQALGYDIFNPLEVIPEFTADVGVKRGEKVDYAILKDGKPIILFECKWCGADLAKAHASHKYIGLFDGDKKDDRMQINDLNDIYKYEDRLNATVKQYDG